MTNNNMSSTDALQYTARTWLEAKQELVSIQKEASVQRKRVKLQAQVLVKFMCDEQTAEVVVGGRTVTLAEGGKLVVSGA
jgi:hypothetical protein